MNWSNLFSTKNAILLVMPIMLILVLDNVIAAERFAEDRSEYYLEYGSSLPMQFTGYSLIDPVSGNEFLRGTHTTYLTPAMVKKGLLSGGKFFGWKFSKGADYRDMFFNIWGQQEAAPVAGSSIVFSNCWSALGNHLLRHYMADAVRP